MTLGQMIQEQRKQTGLSQEALGEKLHVSRQAVSKWESDAAVPEVDTLIAMRLFQISLGVLLQAEEPVSEAEELTDRELAAIERIVRRYVEEMEGKRTGEDPPKKRRGWLIFAGICAALLLISLANQLSYLKATVQNLQNQIGNIEYAVSVQISGMAGRLSGILNEQSNLFADFGCQLESVDLSAGTVTFAVNATPKTYAAGMTVDFIATTGEDLTKAAGVEDAGHRFRAKLTCALTDDINISAASTVEGVTSTQTIEQFLGLLEASRPRVSSYLECARGLEKINATEFVATLKNVEANLTVWAPEKDLSNVGGPSVITGIKVGLFHNGKLLEWSGEQVYAEGILSKDGEPLSFSLPDVSVTLSNDDWIVAVPFLTDSNGRTYQGTDDISGLCLSNGKLVWNYISGGMDLEY